MAAEELRYRKDAFSKPHSTMLDRYYGGGGSQAEANPTIYMCNALLALYFRLQTIHWGSGFYKQSFG